ncbi:MAG: hypothetical protein ABIQ90_00845 [Polaromonas sp.]
MTLKILNINSKSFVRVGLSFALAAFLVGCATRPNSPPPEIVQRIQAASTPVDHESLAQYYLGEAASAKASAELHRKMAKSYQARGSSNKGFSNMPAHCNSVVQMQESIAAEYTGMAAEHQEMSQQLKP